MFLNSYIFNKNKEIKKCVRRKKEVFKFKKLKIKEEKISEILQINYQYQIVTKNSSNTYRLIS